MPDIRYVCLSDMHLGEEDSLLTNLHTARGVPDPSEASPVMRQLVECLRTLVGKAAPKPTLILNGDILELALTTTNQAAMAFARFIELVMPPGKKLFSRIIYIPGNHDHHVWEVARESQYGKFVEYVPVKRYLDPPWHTTKMFIEDKKPLTTAYLLTKLVQRYSNLKEFTIETAYPNFALFRKREQGQKSQKCIIFHHGHFIESIYQFMSFLRTHLFTGRKMPTRVREIEAENFAWIDFFWSTMGRSEEDGEGAEFIYEKMQDRKAFKKFLYQVVDNLAKEYDLPGWDRMDVALLKLLIRNAVNKFMGTERNWADELSENAEKGLRKYVAGPLRKQILSEREEEIIPKELSVTFVFGHTHKPFQKDMDFEGYPQWVNVYNTGGWIVDTPNPQSIHGGAVVLVDEEYNAVSIRMYNDAKEASEYRVSVEEATQDATKKKKEKNELYDRISKMVDPSKDPWKTFSEMAARAVYVRRQHLRERIYGRN